MRKGWKDAVVSLALEVEARAASFGFPEGWGLWQVELWGNPSYEPHPAMHERAELARRLCVGAFA